MVYQWLVSCGSGCWSPFSAFWLLAVWLLPSSLCQRLGSGGSVGYGPVCSGVLGGTVWWLSLLPRFVLALQLGLVGVPGFHLPWDVLPDRPRLGVFSSGLAGCVAALHLDMSSGLPLALSWGCVIVLFQASPVFTRVCLLWGDTWQFCSAGRRGAAHGLSLPFNALHSLLPALSAQ